MKLLIVGTTGLVFDMADENMFGNVWLFIHFAAAANVFAVLTKGFFANLSEFTLIGDNVNQVL